MKKKLLVLLGIFLSLNCVLAQLSQNIEVTVAGNLSTHLGENKTKVTDLSISGIINDSDFTTISQMTALKNLDMSKVNIENGKIPNRAFQNRVMDKIILPISLKIIGSSAFYRMTASSLDFSTCLQLEEIGFNAFYGTKLSDNVLDFSKHTLLTRFPSYTNGTGTFANYHGQVILPLNMKEIPAYAFALFGGNVDLHEGIEKIGSFAFSESIPSKPLVFPASLKIIVSSAFYRMTASSLDFSTCMQLEEIGFNAFYGTKLSDNVLDFSKHTLLTRFPSYTNGTGTFANYHGQVILPLNMKEIPAYAFALFGGNVDLHEGIEKIGANAFTSSTIQSISLPLSLIRIENNAFSNCTQLEEVTSCSITPPQLGNNVFVGVNPTAKLSVPKSSLNYYQAIAQWSGFVVGESSRCSDGIKHYVYAPNSYIFDINKKENGGLYIPVGKAYAMWENNKYYKDADIPSGSLSASVYWEDVSGLIRSVTLEGDKIKVMVDKSKGKGNAVVALHNGTLKGDNEDAVLWSWHIWVTDDPTDGVQFGNAQEMYKSKNLKGETFIAQYMDRNLGASVEGFLGYDWHKSGGLMYQWGRKDPFPPLVSRDGSHYVLDGFIKDKHKEVPFVLRKFDNINDNIPYATKNPFTLIINTDASATWFSNLQILGPTKVYWDLWSDNAEGRNGNHDFTYQLKSEFDPCPEGWRIPSYSGRVTINNFQSPWGRQNPGNQASGGNDDSLGAMKSTGQHSGLPSIKVYPGLGMDFSGVVLRNIGKMPIPGNFEYYSGSNPNIRFQDEIADGSLWSATYTDRGARVLLLISDFMQRGYDPKIGWQTVLINQSNPSQTGNAVRCMRDPNAPAQSLFVTEYIAEETVHYTEGLKDPNSYIVSGQTFQKIPVSKAFSVNQLYLTDHQMLASNDLKANVYWTTNPQMIRNIYVEKDNFDARNSQIIVELDPSQTGNAVVSLHNGSISNPVYWSWHLWSPAGKIETFAYTTEKILDIPNKDIINPTQSGFPPLATTFMDRNLGAIEALPIALAETPRDETLLEKARHSGGMQYQWGRKDPIPTFKLVGSGNLPIYLGIAQANGSITYTKIDNLANYEAKYKKPFSSYSKAAGLNDQDKNYLQVGKIIKYSVQNPLVYMHDSNGPRDWVSQKRAMALDRWGHSTQKSPFDPCPSGWRVPDHLAIINFNHVRGTSPWYNGRYNNGQGASQGFTNSPETYATEGSKAVKIPGLGWIFNSEEHKIGAYPITSVRGHENAGEVAGVWSALFVGHSTHTGKAYQLEVLNGHISTASVRDAQYAMDVRCAKDEPRYMGEPQKPWGKARNTSAPDKIIPEKEEVLSESNIQISPNPTSGIFKVALKDIAQGTIQVVDISGNLVFSKSFRGVNEVEVNIQAQRSGVFLVNIQSGQQIVTKKIIKN